MKRIFGFIAIALFLLVPISLVRAEIMIPPDANSLPEDWTKSETLGSVTVENGVVISLYTTADQTGKADVTTAAFSAADKKGFSAEFNLNMSGVDANSIRSVQLTDNSKTVEIINIRNKAVSVFGAALNYEVEENKDVYVSVWVDFTGNNALVKFDGQTLFSGSTDKLNVALNTSALRFKFRNYRLMKGTITSVLKISRLQTETINNYLFTANISDGETVVSGNFSRIAFDFGEVMSDETYSISNMGLTFNGEQADFTAEKSGSALYINSDFSRIGTYSVKLNKITDIFGVTQEINKTITFNIADESYIPPSVILNGDIRTSVRECESVLITANAQAVQIDRLELFVNGSLAAVGSCDEITYLFEKNAGTYEIYAVVTDGLGVSAKTDKITVTVTANDKPVISAGGFSEGEVFENDAAVTLTADAFDNDGINHIDIYLNNSLYETVSGSHYENTLSGLSFGNYTVQITAYDPYGASSNLSGSFSVVGISESKLYGENFDTYTDASVSLPSGIVGLSQRGYVAPVNIDEAHGYSMAAGIETVNPNYSVGDKAYITIPAKETTSYIELKFDYYISQSALAASPFSISFKKSGSTESIAATFYEGQAKFGTKIVPCNDSTWYNCTFKINVSARKFDVLLYSDETGLVTVAENQSFDNGLDKLSFVRIWGPSEDTVKTFIAIDNVETFSKNSLPTVAEIGYDGITGVPVIDYEASSIDIYLTGDILNSSVKSNSVTIETDGRAVKTSGVQYDIDSRKLTVALGEKLRTNTVYNVLISENVMIDAGAALGKKLQAMFTSSCGDYELKNVKFISSGESAGANLIIDNTADTDKDVVIIASVWKENEFVRLRTFPLTISANNTTSKAIVFGSLLSEETAELYIWDCEGITPKMLANKIYRYKK